EHRRHARLAAERGDPGLALEHGRRRFVGERVLDGAREQREARRVDARVTAEARAELAGRSHRALADAHAPREQRADAPQARERGALLRLVDADRRERTRAARIAELEPRPL